MSVTQSPARSPDAHRIHEFTRGRKRRFISAHTVPGHARLETVPVVLEGRQYNPPMSNNLPIVRRTFLGMGGAAAIGHSLRAFAVPAQTPNAAAVKIEKDVVVGKGGDT